MTIKNIGGFQRYSGSRINWTSLLTEWGVQVERQRRRGVQRYEMIMTYELLGNGNILFKEQGAQWTHRGKSQKKKGNERVETIHSKESGWEGEGERKLAKVKRKQGVNEKKVFWCFYRWEPIEKEKVSEDKGKRWKHL